MQSSSSTEGRFPRKHLAVYCEEECRTPHLIFFLELTNENGHRVGVPTPDWSSAGNER